MKNRMSIVTMTLASLMVACSQPADVEPAAEESQVEEQAEVSGHENAEAESFEIVPGLSARIFRAGSGDGAQAGDLVEVHYTGWLYDESATDNRGEMFDSSVERGERFSFPLGAGRVIKGWDQGVAGMQIGEIRELTIAPEMAYGDREISVIPSGSTLVFEVELFSAESRSGPAGQ